MAVNSDLNRTRNGTVAATIMTPDSRTVVRSSAVTEPKLKIRKPHPMSVFQNMRFRIHQHVEEGRLRVAVVQRT
jgi:hypothetical protein